MTNEEALKELSRFFLGSEWYDMKSAYLPDSVRNEELVNAIIQLSYQHYMENMAGLAKIQESIKQLREGMGLDG